MRALLGCVISLSLFSACAVGQSIADITEGPSSTIVTIHPADGWSNPAGRVIEFGGPEKVKGVALPAEAPQFHSADIPLKRTFPAGRYKIQYTLYSQSQTDARIGLYCVLGAGSHLQITFPRAVTPGQPENGQAFFFATRPFAGLALKKMDTAATVSQAVTRIVLTDLHQREYPRMEGYYTVLQYPAPWGLRNEALEQKLRAARTKMAGDFDGALKVLAEVGDWLDRRSAEAELRCRMDYLVRADRLLGTGINKAKDGASRRTLQEKDIDELEKKMTLAAGGVVRPELGTDVFTWLKAWSLVGTDAFPEYSEPTPYQRKFFTTGDRVDLESSWTTSVYTSPRLTVTYSVLTPMTTFDMADGKFRFNFMADKFRPSPEFSTCGQTGWFQLAAPGKSLLFVVNRKPSKAEAKGDHITLDLPAGSAVGMVAIAADLKPSQVEPLAQFYRRLLLCQPVQCVQVQKGDRVQQQFEYKERPCDWPVRPIKLAPLPHLATLSLSPKSKYRVTCSSILRRTLDGWGYMPDSDRLEYILPKMDRVQTHGINVWADESSAEVYREIRKDGCQTVRLVCGAGSNDRWDWKNLAPVKERLQNNLKWAKAAGGLKVGIEMHGNWFPDGLSGTKGFSDPGLLAEFIKRWKQTIEWCEPYRDVVGWFDIQNEPHIAYEHESVRPYFDFMRKMVQALRPAAKEIPILVEAPNDANPVGLEFWEDLGDDNVIAGFHDYWPHMFTHQRVVEPGDPAMPAVFYPSFMPMIEWTTPSWNNASPHFHYWDRYKCDAISLPVYKLMITKGARLDNGEYGVVGYAGQTSPRSGAIWLRHALERFRRMGINHNVYGYTGGFTWNVPTFKQAVTDFWRENSIKHPISDTQHPIAK